MNFIHNHEKDYFTIKEDEAREKGRSLVFQAWAEFCEDRGWSSKIKDGYTASFEAFDELDQLVYRETFGE
jgi:hypothetical protein